MSWSIFTIGRAGALRAKVAADLANIKCSEPEETIKNTVAATLDLALAAFPPNYALRIDAAGSQHAPDHSKPDERVNSLSVKLEPIYGFVE